MFTVKASSPTLPLSTRGPVVALTVTTSFPAPALTVLAVPAAVPCTLIVSPPLPAFRFRVWIVAYVTRAVPWR